jgi:formate dehydrogenase subunit delta
MSGSGTVERLVYMANQIATFFESQPHANAPLEIAKHINAFWVPSMRQTLIAYVESGGEGLRADAIEAAKFLN